MKIRLRKNFTSVTFYRRKYPNLRYISQLYIVVGLNMDIGMATK